MRDTRLQLILGLLIALTSCGQIINEIEAIKKNKQGLAELNSGQFDKAIVSFKEAIKNQKLSITTRAAIYRNIAQTFSEMNQQDSSIYYSTLSANCYDKDSYEYLVNISDVEILTGKTADAIAKLQRAVKMEPNKLAANNTLGLIYLGDYGPEFAVPNKALQYNKKAFEINNDRITEDVLGRNYFEVGDYNNAEMHYNKLKNKYPDILPYSFDLGMIKFKLRKFEEAELLFNKVIEADSSMVYIIKSFKDKNE